MFFHFGLHIETFINTAHMWISKQSAKWQWAHKINLIVGILSIVSILTLIDQ
jgi:hypothetical protein